MDCASKLFLINRASKGGATPESKLKVTLKMPNIKVFYKNFRDLEEDQVHSKWEWHLKKFKETSLFLKKEFSKKMKIIQQL